MFILPLIGLVIVFAAAVAALNASSIPGLRDWTGAAPLQDDDATDQARPEPASAHKETS